MRLRGEVHVCLQIRVFLGVPQDCQGLSWLREQKFPVG